MVWMAIFHFCFDLSTFGLLQANFYRDPFWTTQRTLIVSLFLFCAGAGQVLAWRQGVPARRFAQRWMRIAACAIAVSLGSAWMFPQSWISFGILHGMALMLLLARLSVGWPLWVLAVAGAVALWLPQGVAHPFFDSRWTNWVGLVTHKPRTEDYVPLLPWMGVMWWAMLAARIVLERAPVWIQGPVPAPLRLLSILGRWSLSFYMLHQPVLLGALMLWQSLFRPHS